MPTTTTARRRRSAEEELLTQESETDDDSQPEYIATAAAAAVVIGTAVTAFAAASTTDTTAATTAATATTATAAGNAEVGDAHEAEEDEEEDDGKMEYFHFEYEECNVFHRICYFLDFLLFSLRRDDDYYKRSAIARRKSRNVCFEIYLAPIGVVSMAVVVELTCLFSSSETPPSALWLLAEDSALNSADRLQLTFAVMLATVLPITVLTSRFVHRQIDQGQERKFISSENTISIVDIRSWLLRTTFLVCQCLDFKLVEPAELFSSANTSTIATATTNTTTTTATRQLNFHKLPYSSRLRALATAPVYLAHLVTIVFMLGLLQALMCVLWRFLPPDDGGIHCNSLADAAADFSEEEEKNADFPPKTTNANERAGGKAAMTVRNAADSFVVESATKEGREKIITGHSVEDPLESDRICVRLPYPFVQYPRAAEVGEWECDCDSNFLYLQSFLMISLMLSPRGESYLRVKAFAVAWSTLTWWICSSARKHFLTKRNSELILYIRPPWQWRASTMALIALLLSFLAAQTRVLRDLRYLRLDEEPF